MNYSFVFYLLFFQTCLILEELKKMLRFYQDTLSNDVQSVFPEVTVDFDPRTAGEDNPIRGVFVYSPERYTLSCFVGVFSS